MIEVTINNADGVNFVGKIKILQPDRKFHGVGVHLITERGGGEFLGAMKLMGMRKVGEDYETASSMYAESYFPYLVIKIIQSLLTAYWWSIRWLYLNACVFRRIPESQPFSWRYFTPYMWCISILRRKLS